MLIRLRSRDGLERVNISDTAAVADLRNQIFAQLAIPQDALILSTHQDLLLSKAPTGFPDMTETSARLSDLGISHGSVVFMSYDLERSVAGPTVMTPAGSIGKKMTMEDLIALQTRIERQEVAHCKSVSLDRDAANVFQVMTDNLVEKSRACLPHSDLTHISKITHIIVICISKAIILETCVFKTNEST